MLTDSSQEFDLIYMRSPWLFRKSFKAALPCDRTEFKCFPGWRGCLPLPGKQVDNDPKSALETWLGLGQCHLSWHSLLFLSSRNCFMRLDISLANTCQPVSWGHCFKQSSESISCSRMLLLPWSGLAELQGNLGTGSVWAFWRSWAQRKLRRGHWFWLLWLMSEQEQVFKITLSLQRKMGWIWRDSRGNYKKGKTQTCLHILFFWSYRTWCFRGRYWNFSIYLVLTKNSVTAQFWASHHKWSSQQGGNHRPVKYHLFEKFTSGQMPGFTFLKLCCAAVTKAQGWGAESCSEHHSWQHAWLARWGNLRVPGARGCKDNTLQGTFFCQGANMEIH